MVFFTPVMPLKGHQNISVEKDGCVLHSMASPSKVSNVSPCQFLNLFSNFSPASVLLQYN